MEVHDWLSEVHAADVMVRDIVTLRPNQWLADAAAIFLQQQISGAPVVNETGQCVGVITVSDILLAEKKVNKQRQEIAASTFWNSNLALPASVYQERLEDLRDKIAPPTQQPVERFMTTDLVLVSEDQPLSTVVQYMVDAHVHRVVVLDASQQLCGLISTTDVLAALLRERHQPATT